VRTEDRYEELRAHRPALYQALPVPDGAGVSRERR
jgi:hypothetical protein